MGINMPTQIKLDALYPEMEEATIGKWLVAAGDAVIIAQPLAELITDKVVYEFQSTVDGVVLEILLAEKSTAPVGVVLVVIGNAGEVIDTAAIREENNQLISTRETMLNTLHLATSTAPVKTQGLASLSTAPSAGGAVRATPAARRIARERNIDLSTIKGTGPGGMITEKDL
jgi:pyruvate dehydrogenase E2 component (dihydrolipoamide acetyltransferase)